MSELDANRGEAAQVLAAIGSRATSQMQTENFPVALRVVPRHPRGQLARVYAFARFVDDVGDEAPGDRTALLDLVEQDLRVVMLGASKLPPVAALRPVIDEHAVPLGLFEDLIEANRVDQYLHRYATFEDLLGYCRLSATPIGRIVLYIADGASAQNVLDSDAVCAALQVLEHCQDVGEDARAGRVYLPASDLSANGVSEAELLATQTSRAVRRVVHAQVDRALEMLESGPHLVRRLSGWARLAVSGYVAGGLVTAKALQSADYDVLARRIHPGKLATALRAARLSVGG